MKNYCLSICLLVCLCFGCKKSKKAAVDCPLSSVTFYQNSLQTPSYVMQFEFDQDGNLTKAFQNNFATTYSYLPNKIEVNNTFDEVKTIELKDGRAIKVAGQMVEMNILIILRVIFPK